MSVRDPRMDRAVDVLRSPVELSEDFDRRVMDAVREAPRPARAGRVRRAATWLIRPHPISVRPILLAAAAAVVIAVIALDRGAPAASEPRPTATGAAPVQFVLVAPGAASVNVIGDFNDWRAEATPMHAVNDGLWTVVVPLDPGRYRYAFLVDGTTWTPDPAAPRALDDDFGRPNSVLTIGGT